MTIKIFDTAGNELKLGDFVQIQERRNDTLTFFCRVEIVNDKLWPLDAFCFDRIFKIDSVPSDAKHSEAEGSTPEYWMHPEVELKLIEEGRHQDWRNDVMYFSTNPFYKISA